MQGILLDTSALAKLYHQEAGSRIVEQLLELPQSFVVLSRLSLVEIESVIAIKVRIGELAISGQDLFRRRLRADIAQGRIRIGPPIEDRHFRSARILIGRWTQSSLLLLSSLSNPA